MNIPVKKTMKERAREEFEEHFYATWPGYIRRMTDQELKNINEDRLKEVNASYPETMVCLKGWVLQEMAERGI